eukprot:SRR837773.18631.p2 GENE.SRR837773.18631~~SRR837773.18631.p2  ORF type:complete len:161 (+),score=65.17 SRR837773.18631:53-535(+)
MAGFGKIVLAAAVALLAPAVAEEVAAVEPAFGAGEVVQEVVKQQGSLRGAAAEVGEVELEAQAAVQNACHSGLVGQAYSYAPACFDACSGACAPLGQAISAYMTKGGQSAAKKVICANKSAFQCALTGGNLAKCQPLIAKAAGFGFKLPSSRAQLNQECR